MKRSISFNIILITVFLTTMLFNVSVAKSAFFQEYYEEIDTFALKPRFGIFFDYGLTYFTGQFSALPGIPDCCPEYNGGNGRGITAGGLFTYHFTVPFSATFRGSYATYTGLIKSKEETPVIIDGKSSTGIFEHSIDALFGTINLEPMADYAFLGKLTVHAGMRFGFGVYSHYTHNEIITDPPDRGTFIDGTRQRNFSSGKIPETNSLQLSALAGLSYDFKLNKKESLIAAPEIFFYYGLNNQVSGLNWKSNTLRIGLSVKYKEPPPPPPPPEAPLDPPDPEYPPPPKPPVNAASVSLVMVDSTNNETKNFNVRIEDFISLNMRPLLTYVFFDENSFEIPKRYIKLSQQETNSFKLSDLENLVALKTYYYVLNIIGKRLKDNPDYGINIIGTNCNMGSELNNKDLSMKRAVAVKDYFTAVWGIPESQMSVEARNLPKQPSNNDEPGGLAENRRVEIVARNNKITEPVITIDTLRKFATYNLRFYPKIKSTAGVSSWNLIVKQGRRELIHWDGESKYPDKINWQINQDDSSSPKRGGLISYTLSFKDTLGNFITSPINTVPVDQLSIDRKRLERISDKEFEYYSLILFDYGKSELGAEHKTVLDFVKNRVTPDSKVIITGHTDAMGDEKVNKRISEQRAKAAAKRLGIPNAEVKGMGKTDLLYDNTLPEGRFYCRTVNITIETPVKEN